MRAVRNLVAPPIVIITDSKEFAFNFPTRYRIDVSSEKSKGFAENGRRSRQGLTACFIVSENLIAVNEN